MNASACRCEACTCAAAAEIKAAASTPAVDHNHARLPGVLRYRGLDNEAVMAARMVKVESLVATLRAVLDDLDAPSGVGDGPSDSVAEGAPGARPDRSFGCDPQGLARRHAGVVEEILETALSKLRIGAAGAGEAPVRAGGPGCGADMGTGCGMDGAAQPGRERRA
ncbi:MAG: hypothetical protein ACE5GS_10545 [Kiloniellaceae bacterium]